MKDPGPTLQIVSSIHRYAAFLKITVFFYLEINYIIRLKEKSVLLIKAGRVENICTNIHACISILIISEPLKRHHIFLYVT